MLREGILPEDASTELLDGMVVRKDRATTGEEIGVHGLRHSLCVTLLGELALRINSPARHVRLQLPLICDEVNAPEPDFAIVRGSPRDYARALPNVVDASCVIEVADSSLERDSENKLAIYARSGLPQYIIVNLRNETLEHFTEPDAQVATFRTKVTLSRAQIVTLQLGDEQTIDVAAADLLP